MRTPKRLFVVHNNNTDETSYFTSSREAKQQFAYEIAEERGWQGLEDSEKVSGISLTTYVLASQKKSK